MAYAVRTRKCSKCGKEVTGRLPGKGRWLCIQCSVNKMSDHLRQMHDKRGPAWERYRAAMKRYVDSL